jgi:hypothetical protein
MAVMEQRPLVEEIQIQTTALVHYSKHEFAMGALMS